MRERYVGVSVATLWTNHESPRSIDRPALENPVRIEAWLNELGFEARLALCEDNLVQSQVLFGEKVYVTEEERDWAKVIVAGQSTSKEERGYPGWIPSNQLADWDRHETETFAVVTALKAYLLNAEKVKILDLSFQTRLPVLEENENDVKVATPIGIFYVKKEQITIYEKETELLPGSGSDIVKTCERFVGLPYLWGGMSSFGYDCSGFAFNMHLAHGLNIPRDASDQACEGKDIELNKLLPGDLLFFAFEEGKGRIHHVGFYYGDGKMIHAPKTGKTVEVISLAGSAYEVELCRARRYWS